MLIGMSQEKLGEALGITFQQVQKYENGTNRIGAGRLHRIAATLGVPVEYFYEGASPENHAPAGPQIDPGVLLSAESVDLLKAFARIREPGVRRHLMKLAAALAGPAED
jgi:transcriptional regulator with XRE-family HTH domain